MKRYKLLKDLPNLKKGTILSEDEPIFGINILTVEDNSVGPIFIGNELFEEFFEKIQEEPTDNIHWKPKNGDEYWYIDDCAGIDRDRWDDEPIHIWRYSLGLIKRTKEECEKARNRELAEVRLRRTSTFKPDFALGYGGYSVCYDHVIYDLQAHSVSTMDNGEIVRYETVEEAQKSIKENREDWLIYFGIKENYS